MTQPPKTFQPLCFILMPFGVKKTLHGQSVDFDAVYQQIIQPAVVTAGLKPLRADEEKFGGVIHKAMFERLLLCDYAVADLTSANANVFYELGVRHAQRPASTALMFAEGYGALPFDVNNLRGLPYQLDKQGRPSHPAVDSAALADMLKNCRENKADEIADSPLYQLLQDYPDIQHLKTDVFREQVHYSEQIKQQLFDAREMAKSEEGLIGALIRIDAVKTGLGTLTDTEPGILVDILLSYRACSAWGSMIALVDILPQELKQTLLIQEQFALALNRAKQSARAEKVLQDLLVQYGPSSETLGILGRVYKDLWQEAKEAGQVLQAKSYLKKAINTYIDGFKADWRDAYPGINALTLMALSDEDDPRAAELNPVVTFAVKQKMEQGQPDYWDYATLLELAVLANNQVEAEDYLTDALSEKRELWEGESTARNIKLVSEARADKGEDVSWIKGIVHALTGVG